MSTPYPHGTFVWFELLTQDIDKAMRFHDGLFGWRSARVAPPQDIPGIGRYAIAVDTSEAAVAFITPDPAMA